MKPLQDDALIRRAAGKDASAFEQLMRLHEKSVYNICYRMTNSPDDALDLSQEVFLKLWRTLSQYQFDAAFTTWLYRLTQNVCLDHLRREKRRRHGSLTLTAEQTPDEGEELSVPDPAPLPEEQLLFREQQKTIQAAMAQLPVEQREVLQLRVVQGLAYEQIAEIMALPVGTVKSRLSRARMQLKQQLQLRNFFDAEASNQARAKEVGKR